MKAQITFSPNVVKDPLLDYLQYMKPGYHDPDGSFSPQTKIYAFEADFTGNGKMSFFITDEKNKLGPHGDYQWLVYYPLITGGFQLLQNGVDAWINGPNYIGFIPELRTNGLVVNFKNVISAQYNNGDSIENQVIDENPMHFDQSYFPKYFHSKAKLSTYDIKIYSLETITAKYPNPNFADNVIAATEK